VVGDEHRALQRLLRVVLVAQVRELVATRGVHDRGVGRTLARRTLLAVARNRAIDQPRILLVQRRRIEAEALHYAGTKILDQDVALLGEVVDELARLGLLQVEAEALLAAVENSVVRAETVAHRLAAAHVVAFGRLDLDDFRARVGEQPRAVRARDHRAEVQHADSLQRARGFRFGCTHRAIVLIFWPTRSGATKFRVP